MADQSRNENGYSPEAFFTCALDAVRKQCTPELLQVTAGGIAETAEKMLTHCRRDGENSLRIEGSKTLYARSRNATHENFLQQTDTHLVAVGPGPVVEESAPQRCHSGADASGRGKPCICFLKYSRMSEGVMYFKRLSAWMRL